MSELDRIREITNNEPAPESKEADAPVCPSCGSPLSETMECSNEDCAEQV